MSEDFCSRCGLLDCKCSPLTAAPDWAKAIEEKLNRSGFLASIVEPFEPRQFPSLFQFVKANPVSAVRALDGPRITGVQIKKIE